MHTLNNFDVGIEGTVGVLSAGSGTDGASVGLSTPGFNAGIYLNYVPDGSTDFDKEVSIGIGAVDLKYIKSGNGKYGVGIKLSASAPWPRYSVGNSWDITHAKVAEN